MEVGRRTGNWEAIERLIEDLAEREGYVECVYFFDGSSAAAGDRRQPRARRGCARFRTPSARPRGSSTAPGTRPALQEKHAVLTPLHLSPLGRPHHHRRRAGAGRQGRRGSASSASTSTSATGPGSRDRAGRARRVRRPHSALRRRSAGAASTGWPAFGAAGRGREGRPCWRPGASCTPSREPDG